MTYEVTVSNRGDSGVVSDVGILDIRKRSLEPSHQSAARSGERFLLVVISDIFLPVLDALIGYHLNLDFNPCLADPRTIIGTYCLRKLLPSLILTDSRRTQGIKC